MVPKKKLLGVFIGCSFVAGCSGPIVKKKSQGQHESCADLSLFKSFHDQELSDVEHVEQHRYEIPSRTIQEARLVDIPIPLKSSFCDDRDDGLIAFFTELTQEEIIQFYHREMERFGWLEIVHFVDPESIIIFKKPGRWVAISIRDQTGSFWQRTHQHMVVIQQTTSA